MSKTDYFDFENRIFNDNTADRLDNNRNDEYLSTRETIRKVGLFHFVYSRILTPKDIVLAIKDIKENHGGLKGFTLKDFIWHARYVNSKAIEGYDFS